MNNSHYFNGHKAYDGYDRNASGRPLPDNQRMNSNQVMDRSRYHEQQQQQKQHGMDLRPTLDSRGNYDPRQVSRPSPSDHLHSDRNTPHTLYHHPPGSERSLGLEHSIPNKDRGASYGGERYSQTNTLPLQPSSVSQTFNMGLSKSSPTSSLPLGPGVTPLRSTFSVPQASYSRPSVSELVHVPPELAAFAADPKFQQILLRVKEQTMVNFIALNRMSDDFVESITIDATSKESAQLARNLIETHLKLQMKVKAAENRLLRVQTDLFSTQGEIASGQMVEFMVPSDLIGLVIGKKGSRIKQIESDTNVTSINVRDNGHIMIYGPDSASVQAAREQLELMDDSFSVSPAQADWLANKNNSSIILDLKTSANLIIVKINREKSSLEVVGIRSAVQMAKFLLDTQLEYVDKEIEIEANEREAREKLVAVRKQYGIGGVNNKKAKGRQVEVSNSLPTSVQRDTYRAASSTAVFSPGDDGGIEGVESAVEDTAKSLASTLVMDSKLSSNKAVEDALDALISGGPSNTPLDPSRTNIDSKKKNNNSKKKGRDRRDEENEEKHEVSVNYDNRDDGKNNVGSTRYAAINLNNSSNNKPRNKQQDEVKKNTNKDKRTRKLEGGNHIDNNDPPSLLVIPPAPLLVVPPPPPPKSQPSKTNNDKAYQKICKNDSSNSDSNILVSSENMLPSSATVPPDASTQSKIKKDAQRRNNKSNDGASFSTATAPSGKESMLIRINNPFADKSKPSSSAGAETESSTSSQRYAPPKLPMSTAVKNSGQSGEAAKERGAGKAEKDHAKKKGEAVGGGQGHRKKKDNVDLNGDIKMAVKLTSESKDEKKERNVTEGQGAEIQKAGSAVSDIPLPPRNKRAGPPNKALIPVVICATSAVEKASDTSQDNTSGKTTET